jgi:flagellar FliJ protein
VKRFRFKLATVLKVKNLVEEERQRQLRRAETDRDYAREQLSRRQTELEAALEDYKQSMQRMQRQFNRRLADDYHQYVGWLDQTVKMAVTALQQCDSKVTQAREALLAAAKERKILDKLQARAYQKYQAAELKMDIDFLDELGTGRFVRRESDV